MTGLRLSATVYLPREMVPKAKPKESKMTIASLSFSERGLLSEFVHRGRSIISGISRESLEWIFGGAVASLESRGLVCSDAAGFLSLTAEGAEYALLCSE